MQSYMVWRAAPILEIILAGARQRRGLGPIFGRTLLDQCSSKSAIQVKYKKTAENLYIWYPVF